MSSPTSALSSLGSGSSSTTPTTFFTGMSQFSSSLNQEISQEVQIASLPIQLLQNNVNDLTNQQSELNTLSGDVTAVETAISTLATDASSMLYGTVSDGSATATVTSGATAGSYSLQISNLGSYSDALSVPPSSSNTLTTVTDPTSQNISAGTSYTLTVTNGSSTPVTTNISYSGGNLDGLAQAINESNAGVEATVVDVGSNSADYRLSLQSDNLGPVTMQLNDGTQNLLAPSGPAGVPAEYSIQGQTVYSDSDTVTLAPGLNVQLMSTNSSPATVTVAADPTNIGNDLSNFVSKYNAAMTELDNNRGQTDVALAGESIVYQLTDALQGLANYMSGSGNISSMQALGVDFADTTGQLSFTQSAFDAATSGQTDALQQFLGSPTGGGFLETATNTMTQMLDPTQGVIPQATSTLETQITSVNTQITQKEAAVTLLQNTLTQQMAAADTMIYSLQQQQSEMQSMFTAEQDNDLEAASV
jgi:flagellar hook-associated protein 2